jgi:hypothetical protein
MNDFELARGSNLFTHIQFCTPSGMKKLSGLSLQSLFQRVPARHAFDPKNRQRHWRIETPRHRRFDDFKGFSLSILCRSSSSIFSYRRHLLLVQSTYGTVLSAISRIPYKKNPTLRYPTAQPILLLLLSCWHFALFCLQTHRLSNNEVRQRCLRYFQISLIYENILTSLDVVTIMLLSCPAFKLFYIQYLGNWT